MFNNKNITYNLKISKISVIKVSILGKINKTTVKHSRFILKANKSKYKSRINIRNK